MDLSKNVKSSNVWSIMKMIGDLPPVQLTDLSTVQLTTAQLIALDLTIVKISLIPVNTSCH
jgi:hypothetical protein